ncbi:protein SPEAR1-like [Panicum virgatum]|nr:protein SPEAR1-like [Panicum virgatum]
MGSSSFFPAGGEMCTEGSRPAGRRGAKKQAATADHHKANRQPQRGLGVAQLEKIRLHNQMLAAYRSAAGGLHPATAAQQAPLAAAGASSSFQPYRLTNCFEETERGIVRLGQPPQQQHYWMMSSASEGSRSSHGSAEELDLELRL